VGSHYERILAVKPVIYGHSYNDPVSGAKMSGAPGQAAKAVGQQAEYVTTLMGANDLCAWAARARLCGQRHRARS
jgi:hypothetical protein